MLGRERSIGPTPAARVFFSIVLILLAAALLMGAKGCPSEECQRLKAAAEAVCKAAPDSQSCAELRRQAEACGLPVPTPTPPDPPATCATKVCPVGQLCAETAEGPTCYTPQPPPSPEPKCDRDKGENCDCYAKLEATDDWHLMSCTAPKTCVAKICTEPTPPPPPPPPPPAGCSIDGDPGDPIPGYKVALGTQVNQAMLTLRPDCSIGGRCVLTEGRQEWQAKVIAKLKATWGLCAGQHAPDTDEIAVATSVTAPREGWHIYAGPWAGPGTVVWAPNAARGAYAAPGVVVPPPSSACPAPQPPRVWTAETLPSGWGEDMIGKPSWMLRCKEHVPRDVIDCSHIVGPRQCAYCASIGMGELAPGVPRCECPTRPDGHPERPGCEDWIADGPLVLQSRNGASCERVAATMFKRNGGNCRLCAADRSVCGDWF